MLSWCRLCLKKSECFLSLLDNKILKKVESLTSLQFDLNDKLPQNCCQSCADNVITCYNFQQLVVESDKWLREGGILSNQEIIQDAYLAPETYEVCQDENYSTVEPKVEVNESVCKTEEDLSYGEVQSFVENNDQVVGCMDEDYANHQNMGYDGTYENFTPDSNDVPSPGSFNTRPDITSDTSNTESVKENEIINKEQKLLLQQQLCQHVQLLTQHFLLSYEHPEFYKLAFKAKEHLSKYNHLAGANENSTFMVCNLKGSLKLICDWEAKFAEKEEEIESMKKQVVQVLEESKRRHRIGSEYIVQLSPLIIETIANSNVFLYPSLLPKIPFKSSSLFGKHATFTSSENELIAIGLEQFVSYLSQNPENCARKGSVNVKKATVMISELMIPTKTSVQLYNHISRYKQSRTPMNPIQYYYKNLKAPAVVHTFEEIEIRAPIERDKNDLPYQFQQHLYPDTLSDDVINFHLLPVLEVIHEELKVK